ncbi:MAG: ribonuclease J [Anaerolineae bacterium]|nr:ribonuclease J [Anaerolineae bacterium]MDW8099284.1 ribonuclease J [Anaerolineae bacterium]
MTEGLLRIVPLGGVGEIGKNMMVMEYADDVIVIDAGLMFPESDMLGVDLIIPDIEYLLERRDRIRGLILTHGHEDHIGALPYLLPQLEVPIYAPRLTRGLVEVKLREHRLLRQADLHTISEDDVLQLGIFTVEFFHVCHSFPDTLGVVVRTPMGTVVHATDYKFDPNPVDGRPTDEAKLSRLGDEGVLLLLSDSTNVEISGYTPSEQELGETLERLFAEAPGRIIVATFASNLSRVRQVFDISRRYGRRIGVVGRSMLNNVRMAIELGYLDLQGDELLTTEEMNSLPARQVTIICTGSQGEPTSALVRMALGEHRQIAIRPGDTVVLSARPVPGNETMVHRTIDNLFRQGADVCYQELLDVHVSGHGSQEDHRMMLRLTRPRFFVPIHGEYRHLVLHGRLAASLGIPKENIFVIESGQALELGPDSCRLGERVTRGHVFVDGLSIGDLSQVVLRDRHHLARDGFVVAIIALDETTGQMVAPPEILTRGFVYAQEEADFIEMAKAQIERALENGYSQAAITARIREILAELCYEETHRRPMVLPVVLTV